MRLLAVAKSLQMNPDDPRNTSPALSMYISALQILILPPLSELSSLSKIDLRLPRYVQAGDSADLVCSYYLDSHNLYSVKWYKGRHEFYRFMPHESPPVKVFPVKGMKINVSIKVATVPKCQHTTKAYIQYTI